MGEPVVNQLRTLRDDTDPEIRLRLQGLLDDIALLKIDDSRFA